MEGMEIVLTKDGSHTVRIPGSGLTYHSMHGAITESTHIFIHAGLKPCLENFPQPLRVFEMGFGTGLNALLTYRESEDSQREIYYHALDAFPIPAALADQLNFCGQLHTPGLQEVFLLMHHCAWESDVSFGEKFHLRKSQADLPGFTASGPFHLVYFDAFAPDEQPALWSREVFDRLFQWILPGGLLLTYSSKGEIRRAMQQAGFLVEKLPGPPGKREITRAVKK